MDAATCDLAKGTHKSRILEKCISVKHLSTGAITPVFDSADIDPKWSSQDYEVFFSKLVRGNLDRQF